jgi:hypothetical protein
LHIAVINDVVAGQPSSKHSKCWLLNTTFICHLHSGHPRCETILQQSKLFKH